eukprot:10995195-Prorocentrum_lima.AAC.1
MACIPGRSFACVHSETLQFWPQIKRRAHTSGAGNSRESSLSVGSSTQAAWTWARTSGPRVSGAERGIGEH